MLYSSGLYVGTRSSPIDGATVYASRISRWTHLTASCRNDFHGATIFQRKSSPGRFLPSPTSCVSQRDRVGGLTQLSDLTRVQEFFFKKLRDYRDTWNEESSLPGIRLVNSLSRVKVNTRDCRSRPTSRGKHSRGRSRITDHTRQCRAAGERIPRLSSCADNTKARFAGRSATSLHADTRSVR